GLVVRPRGRQADLDLLPIDDAPDRLRPLLADLQVARELIAKRDPHDEFELPLRRRVVRVPGVPVPFHRPPDASDHFHPLLVVGPVRLELGPHLEVEVLDRSGPSQARRPGAPAEHDGVTQLPEGSLERLSRAVLGPLCWIHWCLRVTTTRAVRRAEACRVTPAPTCASDRDACARWGGVAPVSSPGSTGGGSAA